MTGSALPGLRVGVTSQVPPRAPDDAPGNQVWRDAAGRLSLRGYSAAGRHWLEVPGVGHFAFGPEGDVDALPGPLTRMGLVEEAFRRLVLPMVLQTRGMVVLHASAVLAPRGVIALCGIAGTGKSTTALALSLATGHPVWADDVVAIDIARPAADAVAVPHRLRLSPAAARLATSVGKERRLRTTGPPAGRSRAPVARICLLQRDPQLSVVKCRPLALGETLLGLLEHAYCFDFDTAKRQLIQDGLRLAARVACVAISFPPGLDRIADLTDALERLIDATA